MADLADGAGNIADGASPAGRRRLLENGYDPLPICGKAPLWKGWRAEAVTEETLSRIECDPRFANHANTGVKTGRLAVVDIDIRNPDHASAVAASISEILGTTDVERIGSKGKALCYYNPHPVPKITVMGVVADENAPVPLVEFLGAGQQMAAYGIHPATGKPYDWPNAVLGDDLLGTRLTDLPKVSPDKLRSAAEAAQMILSRLGYRNVIVQGLEGSQREPHARNGDPVSVGWLIAALRAIPSNASREDWLRVMFGVKDANLIPDTDDDERIDLLNSWSSGELAGETQPGNYVGYEDVAHTYHSARGNAAPVTVGTIYMIAERYGFRGGPPRVNLMEMASAQDSLVTPMESSTGDVGPCASRWSKLTLRGKEILNMSPARMLVPGWLRDTGFTAILAQRGTGKTVLAVDLALSIATDKDWLGEPVMQGFHAAYLCGEDQENTAAHISAWCKRHADSEVPERFLFIKDVPDLMNAEDCAALAEHIRSLVPEGSRVILVTDTWQRATSRAKDGQNSDRDMALAVENLEALARELGGPAIGCFHPPKAADKFSVMGSSVTENASTGIWHLTKDNAGLKLEVTRIKGQGLGNFKWVAHDTVMLGRCDEFGRQLTGIVAICIGGTQSDGLAPREAEKAARRAVLEVTLALIDGGITVVRSNGIGHKPRDVAEAVKERFNLKLDARTVSTHLAALEREKKLTYVQADKNRRIKAGYQRPAIAERSVESLPKAIPNGAES